MVCILKHSAVVLILICILSLVYRTRTQTHSDCVISGYMNVHKGSGSTKRYSDQKVLPYCTHEYSEMDCVRLNVDTNKMSINVC